jgi:hypothetical protein
MPESHLSIQNSINYKDRSQFQFLINYKYEHSLNFKIQQIILLITISSPSPSRRILHCLLIASGRGLNPKAGCMVELDPDPDAWRCLFHIYANVVLINLLQPQTSWIHIYAGRGARSDDEASASN